MTKSSRSSSTTSSQDHTFLMPALKLNAEDLWEVTETTAFITNKPVSRARFLEVMRSALVQVGVDFTQAQSATHNKLRRFLPTMANVMELPDLDLKSVGNWTELPSGAAETFLQETKAPCRWGPLCRFPRPQIPPGQAEVRRQTVCPLPEEEAGTSYDGRRVPLPGRLAVG